MTLEKKVKRNDLAAERISKAFGGKETKELHEGISYGSHEMRDGVIPFAKNKAHLSRVKSAYHKTETKISEKDFYYRNSFYQKQQA